MELLPGLHQHNITTLCNFCSNIDLDQLSTAQGYKHHASCADLLQSARNGCESCKLIWDTEWADAGGNLEIGGHDLGVLDTQIIVRTHQKPGDYRKVRYGQEVRERYHHTTLTTQYAPLVIWLLPKNDLSTLLKS